MIFELPIRAQTCASALHLKLAEKDRRGMWTTGLIGWLRLKQNLMKTDNAAPPFLHGFPGRQQIFVTTIQNKSEALVSNTQHPSGARNATVSRLQCASNQLTLIPQNLFFERSVRWQGLAG